MDSSSDNRSSFDVYKHWRISSDPSASILGVKYLFECFSLYFSRMGHFADILWGVSSDS